MRRIVGVLGSVWCTLRRDSLSVCAQIIRTLALDLRDCFEGNSHN